MKFFRRRASKEYEDTKLLNWTNACLMSALLPQTPEPLPSFEPLLTADEAAKLLRIHTKTLQAMARAGKLPCIRMGKYWLFRKSLLDVWVSEQIQSGNQSRRVS